MEEAVKPWAMLVLLSCAGCGVPPKPPDPPGPSEFKVKVDIMLDLPEASSSQFGIPAKLKIPLLIEARSVVVAPEWKRSHYSGRLDVSVTSLDGGKTYFSCKTDVDGETDGPPEHGMSQIFSRACDAFGVLTQTLSKGVPDTKDSNKTKE